MPALISGLLAFFTPVVTFFISVGLILSLVIGAILDPRGWLNQSLNYVIDLIAIPFPQTPNNLKISTAVNAISTALPLIGQGVIAEIFAAVRDISLVSLALKIYKLIPFKAT